MSSDQEQTPISLDRNDLEAKADRLGVKLEDEMLPAIRQNLELLLAHHAKVRAARAGD
ncbi:hypothetical protein WNY37_12075 [Henriciella sp. AS95]|uniref:hypothetical protein n=1 Tax=Henriciella sp. AS95 TaxID=3135782 RepID=UPI0031707E6E